MKDFNFKYLETYAGWIEIEISYGKSKYNYRFTYVWNSPIDLLEWAEKILDGENSEIGFDQEGSIWFLEYDGKNVIVSDDIGNEDIKNIRLKFEYDRKLFCKKLYCAFLDFLSSGVYIPREWEGYNFLGILVGEKKQYNNSEEYNEDLQKIAKLTSREIKDKLIFSEEAKTIYSWLDINEYLKNYDKASLEEKTDILDYIAECSNSYDSPSLLTYRSKKLETLLETPYNILSYVHEYDVEVGFEQFDGYCFAVDGKKLVFDSYTFFYGPVMRDWTDERIIINMCTCTCWECDCIIAEVTFDDFVKWKLKGYRAEEVFGEYTFTRENYFNVLSKMYAEAAAANHNACLEHDKNNHLMQKIKAYYSKNKINKNYEIDKKLFNFITGKDNLEELIKDSLQLGKLANSSFVKFQMKDTGYRSFVLLEKYYGNLGIGIIIEELKEDFKIVKVFLKSKTTLTVSQGTYYPDDEEMYGHISMAIGASDTDFYDNELIFDRDFFEEWISSDVSFNIFALAVPDSIKGYNDFDCIDDKIEPMRKTFVKAIKLKKEKNFEKDFYRVKAIVNTLPITESEYENVESIIFIPCDLVKDEKQLTDGIELNLILFGNVKWSE